MRVRLTSCTDVAQSPASSSPSLLLVCVGASAPFYVEVQCVNSFTWGDVPVSSCWQLLLTAVKILLKLHSSSRSRNNETDTSWSFSRCAASRVQTRSSHLAKLYGPSALSGLVSQPRWRKLWVIIFFVEALWTINIWWLRSSTILSA